MTTRPIRILTAAALSCAAIAIGAAPTQAAIDPEPWEPYTAEDFTSPAGTYCDFDLKVEAIEDEEEVRVDARHPNGSVRVYEFRGKLVSQFTNLSTGKSVTRDLSGRGIQTFRADGSIESFGGVGPFSIGFKAGDPYEQGYFRLDGVHLVTFDADGTRHMAIAKGSQENLCTVLE